MSAHKFIYYDDDKGTEKEADSSRIDEYLKAVETFKDIIGDKIDEYNKENHDYDSDTNGYLEITN